MSMDKAHLLARLDFLAVLRDLLPGGQIRKDEYHHLCPFHDDRQHGNASTSITTGRGKCLSCGKGWDIFSLTQKQVTDLPSFHAVLSYLNERYGGGDSPASSPKPKPAPANDDKLSQVMPVPADKAPPAPVAHYHYGRPTGRWSYLDQAGRLLGHVCRFDRPGKRKEIMPLTLWRDPHGDLSWHYWRHWPAPRPLYGLDRLVLANDSALVLLVEGEKAADAARELVGDTYACLTWSGGSNAVGKADFCKRSQGTPSALSAACSHTGV